MTQTVLILGPSGKIGRSAASAFAAAGWTVRTYSRGTDMTAAALGADVIVNGLNPPAYHNWAKLIPEITAQVIGAARASGATVILPGNVYNFGTSRPGIWDETTPQAATTRKGKIRVTMEQAYRSAGVQTIVLRAGNFILPGARDDVMGAVYLREVGKGRISHPGAPDIPQAYAYLPDWARAAVGLAELRGQLGPFEDVPFPGHTFTVLELQAALEQATGRPFKLSGFPWVLMRLAAPFWELARELLEMRPLWNTAHQLGSAKFDRLLPDFAATPLADVIRASLAGQVNPDQAMRPRGLTFRAKGA